jgi:hypothetical protein
VDALAADSQGNVVVFGNYLGQIDFGGGPLIDGGADEDLYVAKLDPSGAHIASARYGGSNGVDYALAATVDSKDDILLGGSFESTIDFGAGPVSSQGSDDAFVVKLDGQLQHLWSHTFGDAMGQATYALATDAHDNVIATGDFFGQVSLHGQTLTSSGGRDVFVAKYAATGEALWGAGYGGAAADRGRSVATQSTLDIVLTGSFETSIDFGSGLMTSAGAEDVFLAILAP